MNLLTPSLGLLFWTALSFASLILSVIFVIKILKRKDLDQGAKIGWSLFLILAPFFGVILYLILSNKKEISV